MRIDEKIKQWQSEHPQQPFFSLEFFPPKTEPGLQHLHARFDRFAKLRPLWIDVTWGAGGSTSEKTLDICDAALNMHGLESVMHLTCTNMSETLLQESLERAYNKGIRNLLALRGDPPLGDKEWKAGEGEFKHAIDLVNYIKAKYGDHFCIGVAGYPEGHIDNPDMEDDLRRLKEKVDAGASLVITQCFFDVPRFGMFIDKCRAIGINVPILPGILPIQSYSGFKRFMSLCRCTIPEDISEQLELVKDDEQKVKDLGVEVAIKMCKELLQLGVPGLHFYTLNQEASITRIIAGIEILAPCCNSKGSSSQTTREAGEAKSATSL